VAHHLHGEPAHWGGGLVDHPALHARLCGQRCAAAGRAVDVALGSDIALLSYVLEVLGEHSCPPVEIALMFPASAALLLAYALCARRIQDSLLYMPLFRIRTFRISVVGGVITRLAIVGVPFLLPLLYPIGLGYGPLMARLLTAPLVVGAIGMKIMSRPLLQRFGHRHALVWNTVLLGANLMLYVLIGQNASVLLIIAPSLTQGLFSSLQFTCMNSLTYADVTDEHASHASSAASTAQQMALSFGVASASLVAALFLGGVEQVDSVRYIAGLHGTFLGLGAFTILSALIFGKLRARDGSNVSHYLLRKEAVE